MNSAAANARHLSRSPSSPSLLTRSRFGGSSAPAGGRSYLTDTAVLDSVPAHRPGSCSDTLATTRSNTFATYALRAGRPEPESERAA